MDCFANVKGSRNTIENGATAKSKWNYITYYHVEAGL